MPIYEYRCPRGHEFEVVQRMTDGPVTACEACGEPVERVFSPVAVHYKGSGFYTTDYARKSKDDGGDSKGKPESGKSESVGSGGSAESGAGGSAESKGSADKGSADKPKAKTAKD